MNVFTHHDDAFVLVHSALHHFCDDLDEFRIVGHRTAERFKLGGTHAFKFGKIATNAEIAKTLFRPKRRADAALAIDLFDQFGGNVFHQLTRAFAQIRDGVGSQKLAFLQFARDALERVTLAPLRLLGLVAVTECAAG